MGAGAVYLWDDSKANLVSTILRADEAYVIVTAQNASLHMKVSRMQRLSRHGHSSTVFQAL